MTVVPSWVVDPLVPSVQAWTLQDGDWVDAGAAEGEQRLELDAPFAVALRPQDLLDA